MHEVADADRERMRVEYQKGMEELHSRVDKMSSSASSALHKDKVQEEVVIEEEEIVEVVADVE